MKKQSALAAASVLSASRCTVNVSLWERFAGARASATVVTMTRNIFKRDNTLNSK